MGQGPEFEDEGTGLDPSARRAYEEAVRVQSPLVDRRFGGRGMPPVRKHRDAQGSTEHHRRDHPAYDQRHNLEHPEETDLEQRRQPTGKERVNPVRPARFGFTRPEFSVTDPRRITRAVTEATVASAGAVLALGGGIWYG